MTDDPVRRAAASMSKEWADLVTVAVSITDDDVDRTATSIAAAAKIGFESVRRKLNGIRHAASLGYTQEEILDFGQEQTLSMFQKGRREAKYTDLVWLKFQIRGSQRELVQQQVDRVRRVLGLVNSEAYFDWWLAQMINVTDEEIRYAAGEAIKNER